MMLINGESSLSLAFFQNLTPEIVTTSVAIMCQRRFLIDEDRLQVWIWEARRRYP